MRAKFGIHNLLQSPDIGQNSDEGTSNFYSILYQRKLSQLQNQ